VRPRARRRAISFPLVFLAGDATNRGPIGHISLNGLLAGMCPEIPADFDLTPDAEAACVGLR